MMKIDNEISYDRELLVLAAFFKLSLSKPIK